MTPIKAAAEPMPVCCYCDADLSCARCGREQPGIPQPREAFADEIKRADAAPPEASFDNAPDMLGYLNAPAREAGEPDEAIEKIEPLDVEITGPYHYPHDVHPCFRIAAKDRIVASLYVVDKNEDRGLVEAQMIKEAFRLGGKEIDRLHYTSPSPIPEAPVGREEIISIIREKMFDAWNEICSDTDCHPLDIEQLGRRKLGFHSDHWSRITAENAADAIRALKPQDGGKRTPIDLQAPELNTLATDAFREAAQKDGGESER